MLLNSIYYYMTLTALLCYTAIDYSKENMTRSGVWLVVAAVMIITHEIRFLSKPQLYENCNFFSATPENKKQEKNDAD